MDYPLAKRIGPTEFNRCPDGFYTQAFEEMAAGLIPQHKSGQRAVYLWRAAKRKSYRLARRVLEHVAEVDARQKDGYFGDIRRAIVSIAGNAIVDQWAASGEIEMKLASRERLVDDGNFTLTPVGLTVEDLGTLKQGDKLRWVDTRDGAKHPVTLTVVQVLRNAVTQAAHSVTLEWGGDPTRRIETPATNASFWKHVSRVQDTGADLDRVPYGC